MLTRTTANRLLAILIGCFILIIILLVLLKPGKTELATGTRHIDAQIYKFAKSAYENMLFFEVKGTHLCVAYSYQGQAPNIFPVPCADVEDRLITFER